MTEFYSDSETESTPQPAWMAHIPAPVRYHASLSPAAKLFYGEITALTRHKGYCWATNEYFMRLYSVSRASIKSWLLALSKAGFVRVEVAPDRQSRRIYLREVFPSPDAPANVARKLATGGKKTSHGGPENKPQNKTKINEINQKVLNVTQEPQKWVGPGPVTAREERERLSASRSVKAAPPVPDKSTGTAEHRIGEVLALTGDTGSRARFRQIWHIVVKNKREQDWEDAYNATKTRQEARTGAQRPGAYFHAILTDKLRARGITVPTGSRQDQEEARRMIAESMAVADADAARKA